MAPFQLQAWTHLEPQPNRLSQKSGSLVETQDGSNEIIVALTGGTIWKEGL